MPRIIHRSVFKELLSTFVLTAAFLNSILIMEKLVRLSRLLSGVGATLYDMAVIVFYLQPQILLLTIPMSLLLATLLVYGRMNLDNEIIILKASGMNVWKISLPVVLLGLLCFFSTLAVSFYLGPASSVKMRDEITKIITVRSSLAIEEGTFNTSFKDVVIIVKGKKGPDSLEDVFIYDSRRKDEPKVLMAKEGKIFMQDSFTIGLSLKDGYINITRDKNTTELFFNRYQMALNLDPQSYAPKKIEFTPAQLLRKTKSTAPFKEKAALYLEFHRRLSLPAVCLVLIFLGPPLAFMSGKSGKLGGLVIGLSVFTLYYMLLIYGENLVTTGRISHYAGSWGATALLGIFALYLFRKELAK